MAKRTKGNASLTSGKAHGRGRSRVVYVFTEGKVTEPDYIKAVQQLGTLKQPGTPSTSMLPMPRTRARSASR